MSEDLVQPVWTFDLGAAVPSPSLLEADAEHVAVSDRADPLCEGFLLAGGVLAPLPAKVRLPHEDDDDAVDGEDAVRG